MEDKGTLGIVDETEFQSIDGATEEDVEDFLGSTEGEDDDRSLAGRPLFRIAIGGGAALLILLAGYFLTSGGDGEVEDSQRPNEDLGLSLTLDPAFQGEDEGEELQTVRSELALLQQRIELEEIDREVIGDEPFDEPMLPRSASTERRTAVVRPAENSGETPDSTRSIPVSEIAPPVVPPPPRSRPSPARQQVVRNTPPIPAPSSIPAVDPVDPVELWARLSSGGVIGTAGIPEAKTPRNQSLAQVQAWPKFVPGLINEIDETDIVALGQRVRGEVATPIAWLETDQRKDEQYLIDLRGDILYQSGEVAIPEGSQILAKTGAINSSNGYAELTVIGALINGETIPIPAEMITINGDDGDLLIAKSYRGGSRDLADVFTLGALSGLGEALSGDSTTIDIFNSGSTVRSTEGDGNVIGAIIGGGADAIIEQVSDRNDDRFNAARSGDVIFYLEEGQDVEFYIDREFRL